VDRFSGWSGAQAKPEKPRHFAQNGRLAAVGFVRGDRVSHGAAACPTSMRIGCREGVDWRGPEV